MTEAILQVVIFYLIFAAIVTAVFRGFKKIKKGKLIKVVYILILLSPGLFYIPVEVKTFLYEKEFKDVKLDSMCGGQVVYYKVFSIDDNKATVFYVEGKNGEHGSGSFYYFMKENGQWKQYKWETVWTNGGGSASEFILPPYF